MENFILENTPTVEATPDYASGDVVGGKQVFTSPLLVGNPGAKLKRIMFADKAAQGFTLTALLFNADLASTITENAALTMAAADAAKLIGIVAMSTQTTVGGQKFVESAALDIPISVSSGLYVVLLSGGAFNFAAADDATLKLFFER